MIRKGKLLLVFCLLLMAIGNFSLTSNAFASYNAGGAASYAERYATSPNSSWPYFSSDCTNFTSQALYSGGGWPMRYGSTEDTKWYMEHHWYGWTWSNSWTVASYFYNFLRANSSNYLGSWKNPTNGSNSSITRGDMLAYDWDSNGSKDHSGIATAYGTDPNSGYYGDLQCQHTTNRYRAIWHLWPYNPNRATTTIYARRPY